MSDFAAQIEFLVKPQLSDPASPQRGEWPPAPDRKFQAMVATAAEIGEDLEVLKYLESPPLMQFEEALCPRAPLQYVPENFRRGKDYHTGTARHLPVVHPKNNIVSYLWRDVPEKCIAPLTKIVEQLTHIGRATSLVIGRVVPADSVKFNWVPDKDGGLRVRTPYTGRLQELIAHFEVGARSPAAPYTSYREKKTLVSNERWGELFVLRPQRQLDIHQTTYWTDKLRRAVISQAEDSSLPPLVHGHGDYRHVAWAAIPDVGHKYAKGHILGLGCWLPSDVSDLEVGVVGASLMRVRNLGEVELELDNVGLKGLQSSAWNKASKSFATVTPVALDRWPTKKVSPESIVAESLAKMGLPLPAYISCGNTSPIKGTIDARKYPSRKNRRYMCHVVIVWSSYIIGPIIIGADRYFGSGLCRPFYSEELNNVSQI
ncbi:type I-G CRISPR-associated protein Csb2 [Desulfotalea psychrophila]|nr:type I-U CRISPR-associated protein Csb2 [Desulfotalea psychrophila]